jgi:hypothetical protein
VINCFLIPPYLTPLYQNINSMPKANYKKVTPTVRYVTWVNKRTTRGTKSRTIYVDTHKPQSSPSRSTPASPSKAAPRLDEDVSMLDFVMQDVDSQFDPFQSSENKVCMS